MDWFSTFAGISAALAATSLSAVTVQAIRTSRSTSLQREFVRRANSEAAIGSDRISVLGDFFRRDLGETTVAGYVNDAEIQAAFRTRFESVLDYLGRNDELDELVQGPGRLHNVGPSIDARSIADPDIAAAFQSLADGETWNALARIRRSVEIRLRSLVGEQFPSKSRGLATTQLLALAIQLGRVESDEGAQLRYAMHVANRAVHGDEVDAFAAAEALQIASDFLVRRRDG